MTSMTQRNALCLPAKSTAMQDTPTVRRPALLAMVICLICAPSAHSAAPTKAQSLARFDAGYAQCEARYPHMRGHRDKAYAGVWRLKLDATAREQLSATRKSAAYKSESRTAVQGLQKSASASDVATRLEHQCQALWAEAQK